MPPYNQGLVHTYYGSYNPSIKPKSGIDEYMINDLVEKSFEVQKEKLIQEVRSLLKECKDEQLKQIKQFAVELRNISDLINNLIQTNELKLSEKCAKKTKGDKLRKK